MRPKSVWERLKPNWMDEPPPPPTLKELCNEVIKDWRDIKDMMGMKHPAPTLPEGLPFSLHEDRREAASMAVREARRRLGPAAPERDIETMAVSLMHPAARPSPSTNQERIVVGPLGIEPEPTAHIGANTRSSGLRPCSRCGNPCSTRTCWTCSTRPPAGTAPTHEPPSLLSGGFPGATSVFSPSAHPSREWPTNPDGEQSLFGIEAIMGRASPELLAQARALLPPEASDIVVEALANSNLPIADGEPLLPGEVHVHRAPVCQICGNSGSPRTRTPPNYDVYCTCVAGIRLRETAEGIVATGISDQDRTTCSECEGRGEVYQEKDVGSDFRGGAWVFCGCPTGQRLRQAAIEASCAECLGAGLLTDLGQNSVIGYCPCPVGRRLQQAWASR